MSVPIGPRHPAHAGVGAAPQCALRARAIRTLWVLLCSLIPACGADPSPLGTAFSALQAKEPSRAIALIEPYRATLDAAVVSVVSRFMVNRCKGVFRRAPARGRDPRTRYATIGGARVAPSAAPPRDGRP